MTVRASTIRPGFLVSLKTSVSGNVDYRTKVLEEQHTIEGGAQKYRWETERVITDPKEHEDSIKARSRVRSILTSICSSSAFGLLCPEARGEELLAAVTEARKVADDFNVGASYAQVNFAVLIGKIAADDDNAVRAINSEIADLLAAVNDSVRSFDVKAIRDNANRVRELAQMLSPQAAERVQIAIDAARATASEIAKAQKSGDTAGLTVDEATIRKVTEQRTGFLDLDDAEVVAAPETSARGIDYAPVAPAAAVAATAPKIELE